MMVGPGLCSSMRISTPRHHRGEEEGQDGRQVQDADALVVGGGDPAQDPGRPLARRRNTGLFRSVSAGLISSSCAPLPAPQRPGTAPRPRPGSGSRRRMTLRVLNTNLSVARVVAQAEAQPPGRPSGRSFPWRPPGSTCAGPAAGTPTRSGSGSPGPRGKARSGPGGDRTPAPGAGSGSPPPRPARGCSPGCPVRKRQASGGKGFWIEARAMRLACRASAGVSRSSIDTVTGCKSLPGLQGQAVGRPPRSRAAAGRRRWGSGSTTRDRRVGPRISSRRLDLPALLVGKRASSGTRAPGFSSIPRCPPPVWARPSARRSRPAAQKQALIRRPR